MLNRMQGLRAILLTAALAGAVFVGAPATASPASAADVAICHVVEGQVLCVVPDLLHDTVRQAATALREAGLVLGQVRVVLDDDCSDIGTVLGQRPPAGSVLPHGGNVDVFIGTSPSHPCP